MKKRLLSLVLALAMVMSLGACGGPADDKTTQGADTQGGGNEPQGEETILFTDDVDRTVEIPAQIDGIAVSGALAQIILFAIAPEKFVGMASAFDDNAKGIIDEKYFALPEIGSLYSGAELNVESLALAAPDLLIDIGDSKKGVAEEMDKLQEQTSIPSVFIYSTLESMPETFRALGKLLGKEERGEELAQYCERIYDRTVGIMEQVGDNRVKTLYVLGEKGLNVIAKTSYHAELLDMLTDNLAVVDNPLSKGTGNEVTMEQIALWNPDFVIFGPESIYGTVSEMDAWSEVTAIVNQDYVEVPNSPDNWMSMPPSAQRYLGLTWLTAELYPEYCDYDVKAEIKEGFRLLFGCELTDEKYDELMTNAFTK